MLNLNVESTEFSLNVKTSGEKLDNVFCHSGAFQILKEIQLGLKVSVFPTVVSH